MKPLYVMLIGLPGSGKTTVARALTSELPNMAWHVASTDDIIAAEAAKRSTTYDTVFQEIIGSATGDMNLGLAFALKNRLHVIHDQTNLTKKSRGRKLASIPKGYTRIGIVCECDGTERAARLASRSGKTIPAHIDAQMAAQFERPTLEEFDVLMTSGNWREVLVPLIVEWL